MQYNSPVVKETKIKFSIWNIAMITTLCRDENKQSTLKKFWKYMKGNLRAPFSFALLSTLHNKQTWEELKPNSTLSLKQGVELCNGYTSDCTQAWPGVRFLNVRKHFGWHKSFCIFNTKTFPALKLGSYFTFPCT